MWSHLCQPQCSGMIGNTRAGLNLTLKQFRRRERGGETAGNSVCFSPLLLLLIPSFPLRRLFLLTSFQQPLTTLLKLTSPKAYSACLENPMILRGSSSLTHPIHHPSRHDSISKAFGNFILSGAPRTGTLDGIRLHIRVGGMGATGDSR